MVSMSTIVSLSISTVIWLVFPLIVLIVLKKKEKFSIKPVLIGAAVFIVFAMILERLLHMVVIGNNLITNSVLFSIYAALTAGVFEETGRFIAFKTLLKRNTEWKNGLAYGIGHGGIEAILIGAVTGVQYLVFSYMINNGTFDAMLGAKIPASQLSQLQLIKEQLLMTQANGIALTIFGIFERFFAMGIQIALTMVVLYAVKYRKNIYLVLAIILHALMDIPAALYQMKIITNIYMIEVMIGIYFIIGLIFLIKSKKIFINKDTQLQQTINV